MDWEKKKNKKMVHYCDWYDRKTAQYREKEAKYRSEKSTKNKKNPNGDYKNKKIWINNTYSNIITKIFLKYIKKWIFQNLII